MKNKIISFSNIIKPYKNTTNNKSKVVKIYPVTRNLQILINAKNQAKQIKFTENDSLDTSENKRRNDMERNDNGSGKRLPSYANFY